MFKHPVIRSFFAALLLVIFAAGITPRKILHDAIATHKDGAKTSNQNNGNEVGSAGFNCKCDSLVAESPFLSQESFISITPLFSYPAFFTSLKIQRSFPSAFFSALRGPPVNI